MTRADYGHNYQNDVIGSPMTDRSPNPALLTDRYELTMLDAALRDGTALLPCSFEVFARRLPPRRRYGVFAGLGRLLPLLEAFRFDPRDIEVLETDGIISAPTAHFLQHWRFDGTVDAYHEGELYVPGSPVATVTAPFATATLVETLVLSVLNHDSAVASAASRMVGVAAGRDLIEMGARRTHEHAAIANARAAYLAGFAATSNLAAGLLFGVPTRGTAAHSFTLLHAAQAPDGAGFDPCEAERQAFRSQLDTSGPDTTLLVDTFDIERGIENAVAVTAERGLAGPGGIRIDSGDPAVEVRRARQLLDRLGATRTRIVVTGDVDEHLIAQLAASDAPVDAFGVGSKVADGSGHPSAGFVYKLVAVTRPDGVTLAVAKRSAAKASAPGRKLAWRVLDREGFALAERVVPRPGPVRGRRLDGRPASTDGRHTADSRLVVDAWPRADGRLVSDQPGERALQYTVMVDGRITPTGHRVTDLANARRRHAEACGELRPAQRDLSEATPAFTAA